MNRSKIKVQIKNSFWSSRMVYVIVRTKKISKKKLLKYSITVIINGIVDKDGRNIFMP